MTLEIFIYGTLLPEQPQWSLLNRYVADEGWEASVPGLLFDTGFGYPVAELSGRFDDSALVHGRCVHLLETTAHIALEVLDRYEEVHLGLYRRLEVTTSAGRRSWSYSLGPNAARHFTRLDPIPSGNWAQHLDART